jgi:hypothetical protein
MVNVWWVNQGQTFRADHSPDMLWAAHRDLQGHTQPSWDALEDLRIDDVVFHYAGGFIRGLSRVAVASEPAPRPIEFRDGKHADDEPGRRVIVEYTEWEIFVGLSAIPVEARISEPGKGSPFNIKGDIQRAYLFQLTESIYEIIFTAAGLTVTAADPSEYSTASSEGEIGETYLFIGSTDGHAQIKTRRGQGPLRRLLFGHNIVASCELCGKELPVTLLHAAHIKPRSECTPEERVDWPNVAMRACVLGCDALFENGLIVVDENGHVRAQRGRNPSADLIRTLDQLDGHLAPAFSEGREPGFAWHRRHHQAAN